MEVLKSPADSVMVGHGLGTNVDFRFSFLMDRRFVKEIPVPLGALIAESLQVHEKLPAYVTALLAPYPAPLDSTVALHVYNRLVAGHTFSQLKALFR